MEHHPFLELPGYGVRCVLLGSFSCLKNGSYGEWFYMGSGKSNFWSLIEAVYERKLPTKADKVELMREQGVWITDVAKVIERKKENHGCLDANLKIVEYNTEMLQRVLAEHEVGAILCTSAWVAELFVKKVQPLLKLGKAVPPVVKLPSPSPMADQAIRANEEYKRMVGEGLIGKPWDFRLVKFREALLG